jgi:hypothetical protein
MPDLGQTVLFGGSDVHGDELSDTWTWDGGTWTKRQPAGSPEPRREAAIAYDPARKLVILYGLYTTNSGYGSDTWIWNGTAWTRVSETPLVNRYGQSAAFDENTQRILLLTANAAGDSETWTWDGGAWRAETPKTSPPGRTDAGMAFDPVSRRVIVFGGYGNDGKVRNDTWAWDGSNWTLRSPSVSPPPRARGAMTSFVAKNQILLVGGEAESVLSDAWIWNGSTWSQAPSPGMRAGASAIDVGNRVVVVGGNSASLSGACPGGSIVEFWDGSTWTSA